MSFNPWKLIRSDKLYDDYVHWNRKRAAKRFPSLAKEHAVHVMDEEWDYLILLDACRLDLFQEVVDPEAPSVISGGSNTREWMQWNFDRDCGDVVYVAGNPHFATTNLVKTLGRSPFADVVEVWDHGWDETLRTVPPREVTKGAMKALAKYPHKRIIVHYNQPHHPFIADPELLSIDEGTFNKLEGGLWSGKRNQTIWYATRRGWVSKKRAWEGYRRNLELVMTEVGKVVDVVHGRVVVTADHGNAVGESYIYGHPRGLRIPSLVNVPWYVIKEEERGPPDVASEAGEDPGGAEAHRIKDRIRALKGAGKI
ncbi:MAG: hypothetical protein KAJ35_08420 [Thermoplasmata archaeon]|nr:hypothetical protein [Thermoplasmata archaeon]